MTDDRDRLAEELFWEARDLDPADRGGFLGGRCGDDDALRAEIESLLVHHDSAGVFLDEPAGVIDVEAVESASRAAEVETLAAVPRPARIDEFDVEDVLGAGGMSIVYRARQSSPERTVALKMIRPGVASRGMLARFEHEAELLARLHHPGIAQVYQVGTTDLGGGAQPYFVMELVDGLPITEYARARGLGTRQRLELLARVCDAVQHAHTRGVIHRDLKPGNILVTGDDGGIPKVLDFGVARTTDADVRTTTMRTDIGQLIGTLAYMSPEQCVGDPRGIDPRSDVYALGVIGYELLAGRLPYDLRGRMVHESIRLIREDDARPLSTVDRVFRGDVETIVAKSLAKERERRYQTAAALAADLRRYLDHEPIGARPPSALYQARKFARRHRGLVAGLAGVFLALLAGVIATTTQLFAASAARDEAVAVSDFLRDMLASAEPTTAAERDLTVRELLDLAARDLDGRFDGQPQVQAVLRETIGKAYAELGRRDAAERQFDTLARLRGDLLGADHPDTLATRNALARQVIEQSRWADAERMVAENLAACRRALGDDDAVTVCAMLNEARLRHLQGRLDESHARLQSLVEWHTRRHGLEHHDTLDVMHMQAVVRLDQGNLDGGDAIMQHLVDAYGRADGADHPRTLGARVSRVDLLTQQGRFEEAVEEVRRVHDARRRVLGDDHVSTVDIQLRLAGLLGGIGRFDEAGPLAAVAVELAREGPGEESRIGRRALRTRATILRHSGRLDEAEPIVRRVVELQHAIDGPDHHQTLTARGDLADLLFAQGKNGEAEAINRALLPEMQARFGAEHVNTLITASNLAACLNRLDGHAEAETILRENLAVEERLYGEGHPHVFATMNNLAFALREQGRLDEAETIYRELVAAADAALPPDHWQRWGLRVAHANCLLLMTRHDAAERLYLEALPGLRAQFGDGHPYVRRAAAGLVEIDEARGTTEERGHD